MRDGFVRVAASTPDVRVADVKFNCAQIGEQIEKNREAGVKILVLPELAVTAYTCGELFNQKSLLDAAAEGVKMLAECTRGSDMVVFVGVPWSYSGKLYNCAACLQNGRLGAQLRRIL